MDISVPSDISVDALFEAERMLVESTGKSFEAVVVSQATVDLYWDDVKEARYAICGVMGDSYAVPVYVLENLPVDSWIAFNKYDYVYSDGA